MNAQWEVNMHGLAHKMEVKVRFTLYSFTLWGKTTYIHWIRDWACSRSNIRALAKRIVSETVRILTAVVHPDYRIL
jgi:hypothetical protein